MTCHEAFNVAKFHQFEDVTSSIEVFRVVVEDADFFVPQHQSGDLIELFGHHGVLHDHLASQLGTFRLGLGISKSRISRATEEIQIDTINSGVNFTLQFFKNVVEVLKLVLDPFLVVHSRCSSCLGTLGSEASLAFARTRLEMHHCLEHIDLLGRHATSTRSSSTWTLHNFGLGPCKTMLRCGLLLFATGINEAG